MLTCRSDSMKLVVEYECKVKIYQEAELDEYKDLLDEEKDNLKSIAENALREHLESKYCVDKQDKVQIVTNDFQMYSR